MLRVTGVVEAVEMVGSGCKLMFICVVDIIDRQGKEGDPGNGRVLVSVFCLYL